MAWDNTDEEIIAYLSGELAPSEQEAFEQRLQADPALAQAMKRHQAFEQQLREFGAYQKKAEEVRRLNEQFSSPSTIKPFHLLVLVAIIVGLIAGFLYLSQNQQYCPEELYTEFFEPRSAPELAGQAQDAEQSLRLGHSRFNQQMIPQAIRLYEEAIASSTLSPELQMEAYFYLGQSLMIQGKFDDALQHLSKIEQGPYQQLAQWYRALAQLALGQIEPSKPLFEEIALAAAHDRQAQAKSILDKWGNLKDCD